MTQNHRAPPSWHTLALLLLAGTACSEEAPTPLGDAQPPSQSASDPGLPSQPGDAQPPSQSVSDGGTQSLVDADAPEPCLWSVDALLREAGVQAFGGRNCGLYSYTQIASPFASCFEGLSAQHSAVQLTVNHCVDCSKPATFVSTSAGELFELEWDDDSFGDGPREAAISRCNAVTFDRVGLVCEGKHELYRCSEPRSPSREQPKDPPVQPFKLTDLPIPPGQPSTILHLYVSNQSFEDALIDIRVQIDEVLVVAGDFAVEGQHNWLQFDIKVPTGARALYAGTFNPRDSASLMQQIEIPGERWVVLDYWYAKSDPSQEHFTLRVSERPVAFD